MKKICKAIVVIWIFLSYQAVAQENREIGVSGKIFLDYTSMYNYENVPEIIWQNPSVNEISLKNRKLELLVRVNSKKPIRDIKVYLNDQTMRGLRVVKAEDNTPYSKTIQTELLLSPGTNTIKVTAIDETDGMSTSLRNIKVELDEIYANVLDRKDYAILFATDEYNHWDDLVNPVFDTETIAKELESAYGFEVEIVRNPTKKDVLQKLRQYSKKSYLPNDQLFVFFAGHGHFDPFFNQGYIVCKDSKMADEEKLTYISHSNLRDIINYIPCEHIFLAMDACFGGTFDPSINKAFTRGGNDDDIYRELSQLEFINRKLRLKTRMFLTSGGKEYVPDGRPGQHSPFARKFIEALRNYGGEDKILTLNEMKAYVEKIIPEPRFGEFGNNEPGSDFIFITKELF